MDTAAFLIEQRDEIVDAAMASIRDAHLHHYERAPQSVVRVRLELLFDRLVESVDRKDLGPVVRLAETLAGERFAAGFDLSEVQGAMNALEEATWASIVAAMAPERLGDALGMVATVLGAGKDALARAYVGHAARTRAPSIDLRALFAGINSG